PSGWIPLEQLSFMQAVRSPAPELDPVRDKPIAGPEWRAGHLPTLEPSLDIEYTLLQLGVARKGLALQRSPRADLASPRTSREVLVGFLVADLDDRPLDTDLRQQRLPGEAERRVRVGAHLRCLAALEVGVEHEA